MRQHEGLGRALIDAELSEQHLAQELAALAFSVVVSRAIEDRVEVDAGELDRRRRIREVVRELELTDARRPGAQLLDDGRCLLAREETFDLAPVQSDEVVGVKPLQRLDCRDKSREQERLGYPIVSPESRVGVRSVLSQTMLLEQERSQAGVVEATGGLELLRHLRAERFVARIERVVEVTDGNDVLDSQVVPPIGKHLGHHLERRPFPLERRRRGDERVDERRRERVRPSE